MAAYFFRATQQPQFWLIVGYGPSGDIGAWVWGYGLDGSIKGLPEARTGMYIDIIGVLDAYRGAASAAVVRQTPEVLKRRLGVDFVVTRTHTEARHVLLGLRRNGWEPLKIRSDDDADRSYWIRQAPAPE